MSAIVEKHGDIVETLLPGTKVRTKARKVTFAEYGRPTANKNLWTSSQTLKAVKGGSPGLQGRRQATILIPLDEIDKYPIGEELPNVHINRVMTSIAQMPQQEAVPARMVDGKVTYFQSVLEQQAREDRDERMTIEQMAAFNPLAILKAALRVTDVAVVQEGTPVNAQVEEPELVEPEETGQAGQTK